MDPIIGGALIGGIGSIIGGLLGSSAQEDIAEQNRMASIEQARIAAALEKKKIEEQKKIAAMQGQQGAFQSIVEGYRSALTGAPILGG